MPNITTTVIPREQVVDYQLIASDYFFPGKFILNQNVASFNESINTNIVLNQRLTGDVGPNMMTPGVENFQYSSILTLPIFIGNDDRGQRQFVDGLDFLTLILGENFTDIDNLNTKIFGPSSSFLNTDGSYNLTFPDETSLVIQSINIQVQPASPVLVIVNIVANNENVFQFVQSNGQLFDPTLPAVFGDMRTAVQNDVAVGFLNGDRQVNYAIMTTGQLNVAYNIESLYLWGSGRPRPIFNLLNYTLQGNFTVEDDVSGFTNDPNTYFPASSQTYGALVIDSSTGGDSVYSLLFPELDYQFIFSNYIVYQQIQRSVQNGILISNSTFSNFATGITA